MGRMGNEKRVGYRGSMGFMVVGASGEGHGGWYVWALFSVNHAFPSLSLILSVPKT